MLLFDFLGLAILCGSKTMNCPLVRNKGESHEMAPFYRHPIK